MFISILFTGLEIYIYLMCKKSWRKRPEPFNLESSALLLMMIIMINFVEVVYLITHDLFIHFLSNLKLFRFLCLQRGCDEEVLCFHLTEFILLLKEKLRKSFTLYEQQRKLEFKWKNFFPFLLNGMAYCCSQTLIFAKCEACETLIDVLPFLWPLTLCSHPWQKPSWDLWLPIAKLPLSSGDLTSERCMTSDPDPQTNRRSAWIQEANRWAESTNRVILHNLQWNGTSDLIN